MSLKNLYLLRILQLDVYISLLEFTIKICKDDRTINNSLHKQREYLEERKELRKFLNITELWRFQNGN